MGSTRPNPVIPTAVIRTTTLRQSPGISRADQTAAIEKAARLPLAPTVQLGRCRLPHGLGGSGLDGRESSRMSGRRVRRRRASDLRPPPARAHRAAPGGPRAPRDLSRRGAPARRRRGRCRASSSGSCASSSPVASWRGASRASAATAAGARSWSRFPARGGASARRVAAGAWPSSPRTWSTACSAACRCASGCSRCRTDCATRSPGIIASAAPCWRCSCAPCSASSGGARGGGAFAAAPAAP